MKEYDDLFKEYANLNINLKRDVFSEEIIKISYLLKDRLNKYGHDIIKEPYNYSKINDKNISEDEFLNLEYRDIYYIKAELMLLISLVEKNR